MKIMKHTIFFTIATLLLISHTSYTKDTRRPRGVSFELWNKTNEPIYFFFGDIDPNTTLSQIRLSQGMGKLNPSQHTTPNSAVSHYTGNANLVLMIIMGEPKPGKKFKAYFYKFLPSANNKTLYIRVKKDKDKLIFGPQTGPLFGFKGTTDRGYSLKNNIKASDISTEITTKELTLQDLGVSSMRVDESMVG